MISLLRIQILPIKFEEATVNKQVTVLQYTDRESAGFRMLRNKRQLWPKITSANLIGFRKPMRLPCYKLSIINRIKSRDQCWTIITLCVRNMSRHIFKAAGFTAILNSFCSCFYLSFQPSHFTEWCKFKIPMQLRETFPYNRRSELFIVTTRIWRLRFQLCYQMYSRCYPIHLWRWTWHFLLYNSEYFVFHSSVWKFTRNCSFICSRTVAQSGLLH
jgi:hypothetical protein